MKENTEAARSITWELGLAAKSKVSGIFLIRFEHSKASLLFKLFSEDLWYKTVLIYSSWKLLSWAEGWKQPELFVITGTNVLVDIKHRPWITAAELFLWKDR